MPEPATDLSPARIAEAPSRIDPVFLGTPQLVSDELSAALGRTILLKDETATPIGSFKGRGTSLLAERLDPGKTWVCATAGNFGQGLAYAARRRGTMVHAFVSPDVSEAKVAGMEALGARVEVADRPGAAAREHAGATDERLLVTDGLGPDMAEGAGTIAVELEELGPVDVAVVQVGDGALISGIACWLKARRPETTVVGVCASGAPAMARSYAARQVVSAEIRTIATAIAITDPLAESLARVIALVDGIVLVDDQDIRAAQRLVAETLGVAVEPAGAAGVAAVARHGAQLPEGRTALVLTGAGAAP